MQSAQWEALKWDFNDKEDFAITPVVCLTEDSLWWKQVSRKITCTTAWFQIMKSKLKTKLMCISTQLKTSATFAETGNIC